MTDTPNPTNSYAVTAPQSGDTSQTNRDGADHCRDCDTVKKIALIIIIVGIAAIIGFASYVMAKDSNPSSTLNIVLPVFATWIGTVIAFYFGKENFESASKQVRESNKQLQELLKQETPEDLSAQPVSGIMKKISEMTVMNLKNTNGYERKEREILLIELRKKFDEDCETTRLPILKGDGSPAYMIHASSIDKYVKDILIEQKSEANEDASKDKTLADFLEDRKKKGFEFGLNNGFIVVSESATIGEAKDLMEKISLCQDIFVTKTGKATDKLTGWVSNTRLSRYLTSG
jgi:hypothetical protein